MDKIRNIVIVGFVLLGLNSLQAAGPVAASCSPVTLTYCCGFGITNVTFNTINNSSNDGVDGYSDFTAISTTLLEGQSYTLSIQTLAASTQNYAAWIDFNSDGVFDDVTERVFTASSQLNTSGNIVIPIGAVLNTDLRLRVSSDFDFSAPPTPCGDLDRGQAEDYTVVITTNPNPPIAAFSASDTIICDGNVCFTDESLNIPTSWLWDFGDGNTSLQQHPCHTYLADGDYTVSLTATNTNGFDDSTIVDYITVNTAGQVVAATCNPATTSYCCGYGIYQVSFIGINNATPDAAEGYQDFSCSNSTVAIEGTSYPISITTGANNAQDTRVWIDFDNDGAFNNTNEMVMDVPNVFNPTQNILIPLGATLNTPLRMRISSDIVGIAQVACDDNAFGQTEDYSITINLPNSVENIHAIENKFLVYPNPTNGDVNIKSLTKDATIKSVEIYNSVGQQVLNIEKIEQSNTIKMDVSSYNKGIYFLKIGTEDGIKIEKVTVY